MSDRVCPNCGTDTYKAQEFDRVQRRLLLVERQNEELAARNGILTAKLTLEELQNKDHRARLQGKARRQGRVIRRLEEKLRTNGHQPHEGVTPSETTPIAQGEVSVYPGEA